MITLLFKRNASVKVSPLSILFGVDSGGEQPDDPATDLNTRIALGNEFLSCWQVQQNKLLSETKVINAQQKKQQSETRVCWDLKLPTMNELSWHFARLSRITKEFDLNYARLDPMTKTYQMKWISQAKRIETAVTFTYGPTERKYICVDSKHPKQGLVYLEMVEAKAERAEQLTISLKPKQQICYWSDVGLLRAFDDVPIIDRKVPIQPQIQNTYIMQPTITCKRVSDNREIYISQFNWSKSRGQFAATTNITFQSKVDFEYAVKHLLEITVNGYVFYAYCEKPSISRSFNNNVYRCAGRSRLAELSQPYIRPANYANAVDRTHAGICSDILLNSDWILQYSMVDYPVPAESFSYTDKSSASALNDAAKSIGAMLEVNEVTKTINVVPVWPVNPWSTDQATCDIILNESHIDSHNIQEVQKLEANAVFVSGQQNGVSCKIRLNNTPGDLMASDVVDSLITDNQAARQRGTCELANIGNKEESTIVTDIKADLPPIKLGSLVGIQYQDALYKATCDSISINASIDNAGAIDVTQTVKLVKNV